MLDSVFNVAIDRGGQPIIPIPNGLWTQMSDGFLQGVPRDQRHGERAALFWACAAAAVAIFLVVAGTTFGAIASVLLLVAVAVLWTGRYPELALIGLIGVASLDTMGFLFEVGPARITAYQLVLLGVFGWFGWLVASGRAQLRSTGVDLWIVVTLAAGAVAIPSALRPIASLVAFTSLASSLVVIYLVVNLASTPDRVRRTLIGFLVLFAGTSAVAVIERMGLFSIQGFYATTIDGIRARVFFDDPNILGGVLAAAAVVGIPLALAERKATRAGILWTLTALCVAGTVASLSRGALLGLLVGAFVAVLVSPVSRLTRAVLICAGVFGVVGLLVFVLEPAWVAEKLTGITRNQSALNRIYLAEAAAKMWTAHPLGVAPGMWRQTIIAYRPFDLPTGLLESHTTYLTVLVELGIVGLVGVLGILIGAGKRVLGVLRAGVSRDHRALAASAFGGMLVFIIQSLTYSMETSKFMWFLVGTCLAVAATATDEKESAA